MNGWVSQAMRRWAMRRAGWRRTRNFTAAKWASQGRFAVRFARAAAGHRMAAAGVIAALAGAVVIASHARQLALAADAATSAADVFQPVMPGAAFEVPPGAGITLQQVAGGAFVVAAGMRAAPAVVVDLCEHQGRAARRLAPVRVGYHFADVARWAERNRQSPGSVSVRNVALAAPDDAGMPKVTVTGSPATGTLQLDWKGRGPLARWIGDASGGRIAEGADGAGALHREGWLVWDRAAAMRIQRRASRECPEAGDLVVQVFRAEAGTTGKAIVHAFPVRGQPMTAWMRPGRQQVAAAPVPGLEDKELFQSLQQRGLVRLNAAGLAELAPRDLADWQEAAPAARAVGLASWSSARVDDQSRALVARLYRMADGAFVREQVRVFNSERRLLAWRVRPVSAHGDWHASAGNVAAATTGAMPLAASRLFAELPQGWAPWTRIAAWPHAGGAASAQVTLALARPSIGGETLHMLLAGRVLSVDGARLRAPPAPACTGRACPSPDAVQLLELELLPGARSVTLHAAPLEMAALAAPADQQYRHLRVEGNRLAWHALPPIEMGARMGGRAEARLDDRNGALLWSGGSPTAAAIDAGLAPLLGMRSDHPNSIAGMLARLPSGSSHHARLSIDLALQTTAQRVLECVGMRRGRWDGARCHGGEPVPGARQAGLVVLDAQTGDVLAAAGAGAGPVGPANWDEVRNFDRTNPARSALRLPAFQHDGGALRSPGSTFKIVSALGLELAAVRDPQVEALLAGLPLNAINQLAAHRGFAFQTNAATYPVQTRLAHITNFRDQHLDRRAQDGRLGLPQALAYSLNTWFAWSGELADRSLFGRPDGGAPGLQPLEAGALDTVRPVAGMARRLGFGNAWRMDGGLLPDDFPWSRWDALQASAARIDPIHTRHELRQMSIGLRMQATPLQMAVVSAAVGQGAVVAPRLLLALDGREAAKGTVQPLGVRLDRVRAGMKGVVDSGTAASVFAGPGLERIRAGMSGKTGTAPTVGDLATVWFTGWIEPGTLPNQPRRLAVAAFVSHSEATGGGHAAPVVAAVLASMERTRQ